MDKKRIFISYGHSEDEICTMIRQALEGDYDVWMDKEKIRTNKDWRKEIQDGISKSNGVLACLSKHSTRDPGVCLEELSIAVGIHGYNIKTILLEDEKEVQPPATVSHLQWLDMHDWRQRKEKNPEDFQAWFDDKMKELKEILESVDEEFEGDIHTIKTILPACSSYSHHWQYELLNRPFVGREWLTEQMEAWLDNPAGIKIAVLFGDAGVGKSCFAAHYLHWNARAAAGIFCRANQPYLNNAKNIVETLAYLLACRLPEYRNRLVPTLKDQEQIISQYTAAELFRKILIEPLNAAIDGGHETLCIVLDALDECSPDERKTLEKILRDCVSEFPRWLRMLVTMQNDPNSQFHDAQHFTLNGSAAENLDDIRTYYHEQLASFKKQENFNQAIERLTQFSNGIFLYAVLTANSIKNGTMKLDEPETFPDDLSTAFHQQFDHIFSGSDYKKEFRKPLGIILAAPAPMPKDVFRNLLKWKRHDLDDFISKVQMLLSRNSTVLAFSHQYIAHWLSDKNLSGDYVLYKEDYTKKIAKGFYKRYKKFGASKLSAYEAIYLVKLSKDKRRKKLADDEVFCEKLRSLAAELEKSGNLSDALLCYEQMQCLLSKYTETSVKQQHDLSTCYAHCGSILVQQWLFEEALEQFRMAMKYTQMLTDFSSAHTLELQVGYCLHTAHVDMQQEDFEQAEKDLHTALEIQEEIVRYNPSVEHRRILCMVYHMLAVLDKKRFGLARDWEQKCLKLADALVQESKDWKVCHTAAQCYSDMPMLQPSENKKRLSHALEILEQAEDADFHSEIAKLQKDLFECLKWLNCSY